jgi:hypothetical protein
MRAAFCITEKLTADDREESIAASDWLPITSGILGKSAIRRKSVDLSITSSAVLDKPSRLYEQKASVVLVIV